MTRIQATSTTFVRCKPRQTSAGLYFDCWSGGGKAGSCELQQATPLESSPYSQSPPSLISYRSLPSVRPSVTCPRRRHGPLTAAVTAGRPRKTRSARPIRHRLRAKLAVHCAAGRRNDRLSLYDVFTSFYCRHSDAQQCQRPMTRPLNQTVPAIERVPGHVRRPDSSVYRRQQSADLGCGCRTMLRGRS